MESDGLINSFAHLRKKLWWRGPSVADLDETMRRLYFRSGDLAARLCLNGETMRLWDSGAKHTAATLLHAERYLADRMAYELAPWPKGMMRIEPDDAYALPK
ncbi:MAG TPA: hypothetical protein VHX13_04215 [Acidobacteriaceae bacterium]|nr:hypothetical protein [Acidobacteriaceae bacterium]